MKVDFFNAVALILFAKKLFIGAAYGWAFCFIPTLFTVLLSAFAFYKIRTLDKKLKAELSKLTKQNNIPHKMFN